MSILYTSNKSFYTITDAGVTEYTSEKIVNYCNTVKSIRQKNEWKTSGTGAKFMNSYVPEYNEEFIKMQTAINGVAHLDGEIVYTATLGEISGIFKKTFDNATAEGFVMSTKDMQINKIAVANGKCAASVGSGGMERHIALFDLSTGSYRELTEGDVIEDYPSFSVDGSKIYYSIAGLALSQAGFPIGVSPYGLFCYDVATNELHDMLESDSHDYIAPKEERNGCLLFIKKPYRNARQGGNIFKDIVFFPVRIIKAIGGLLNYFSIVFGGESLRSGKSTRDVKSKQMSEKDLFFDGNVLNAEQTYRDNQRRGEQFPGIIPHSWELMRLDKNGNQTSVKKGVMDYTICKNGDIVYSNGNAVIRLTPDGDEQLLEKTQMANNLAEISMVAK